MKDINVEILIFTYTINCYYLNYVYDFETARDLFFFFNF